MLALSSAVSSNNSIDSIAAPVDLTGVIDPGTTPEVSAQNDSDSAFADFLALADSPATPLPTPGQAAGPLLMAQPAPMPGIMALVNPAVLVSSLAIGSVMERAPDAAVTAELLASDGALTEGPDVSLTEPDVTDSDEDGEDAFPAKHSSSPTETAGLTISAHQTHYSPPSSLANASATAINNEPDTAKDDNEAKGPRIDGAETKTAASSTIGLDNGVSNNKLPAKLTPTPKREVKTETKLDLVANSKVANTAGVRREAQPETTEINSTGTNPAPSASIRPVFDKQSEKIEQSFVSPEFKSSARETDSLTKPTLIASSVGNEKAEIVDNASPQQQSTTTTLLSTRGFKAANSLDNNGNPRDFVESKVTNPATVSPVEATKLNNQSSILGDVSKSSKENDVSLNQPGALSNPQPEPNPKVEKAERGSSYSDVKARDRELLAPDSAYGPSTLTSTSAKQALVSASVPSSAQIAAQPGKTEKIINEPAIVKNKNISQVYDKKIYTESKNIDGTVNAKDSGVMSPSYTSITTPVVSVKPTDLPAPVAPAAAMRMVEQVADVADRLSARTNEKVDVRIELEGNRHVDVHVSMQGGRVHADFRSDSPEVRAALSSAWEGFVQSREGAAQRWAEPVFAAPASSNFISPVNSSSGASDSGLTGSGQNQERREAPGREAASNGNWTPTGSSRSGGSAPSSPTTPTEPSGRRPETSRHLSVIA